MWLKFASPQKVSASGIGAPLTITVTPDDVVFPTREVTVSAPATVYLRNSGNTAGSTIDLSSPSVTGTNSADFAVTNNANHPCGSSLAVGDYCELTVTFTPSLIGTETATLNVPSSATSGPQSVPLSGKGVDYLQISPSKTTFPNTDAGHTSADKYITVKNITKGTGSGSYVTINSFTSTNSAFVIDSMNTTCTSSLVPGSSCKIAVQFEPTAEETYNGVIEISDDAVDSPSPRAGSDRKGTLMNGRAPAR